MTAPHQLTVGDIRAQALVILREGTKHEANGDLDAAVAKYKQAYKLCPELDDTAGDMEATRTDECLDPTHPDVSRLFTVSRTIPTAYTGIFQTFRVSQLRTASGRNRIREFFRSEGFLVVDDALSADEVSEGFGLFARYMDAAADIDVTRKEDLLQCFGDRAVGVVGKKSAGQTRFNWFVRSREAVQSAFRVVLFGTEVEPESDETSPLPAPAASAKLMTSFDGCGFFRNPEAHRDFASGTAPWLHVDASDQRSGDYVQGLVNFIDCTDDNDAGLVVVPRSHVPSVFKCMCPDADTRVEAGFTEMELVEASRIVRSNSADPAALRLLQPFRVPLKAGSLALWSSRSIHCNVGCIPRATPRPEQLLRRLVSYVCLQRDPMEAELTKLRHNAFSKGYTTTHQPDQVHWVGDVPSKALLASGTIVTDIAGLPPDAVDLL
jgi:hypothetical protein